MSFLFFFLFVLSFYQHSCNNSGGEMEQMYSTHMYERMNEYDYHVLDPLKDIVLCFLCVCLCVCMCACFTSASFCTACNAAKHSVYLCSCLTYCFEWDFCFICACLHAQLKAHAWWVSSTDSVLSFCCIITIYFIPRCTRKQKTHLFLLSCAASSEAVTIKCNHLQVTYPGNAVL